MFDEGAKIYVPVCNGVQHCMCVVLGKTTFLWLSKSIFNLSTTHVFIIGYKPTKPRNTLRFIPVPILLM